jgi:hypothetical protein
VYQPQLLTVQSLDSITVTAQSFQVPVVEPMPFNGTWEKILPQSEFRASWPTGQPPLPA